MFGIGMGEFLIILVVGLIVFGPKNLPEVGKALGKGLKEFRKAQAALTATLEESVNETPKKSATEKPAEVSVEKKSEPLPTPPENDEVKISLDKKLEPARSTVDDLISTVKENPISNKTAEEKNSITKEKTA